MLSDSVRIYLLRPLEIGLGSCRIPFFLFRHAPFVIGVSVFGIEPDHLAIVYNGAVVVTLESINHTPFVVGIDEFGFKLDRFAVFGDGAVVVPLVPVSIASVAISGSAVWGRFSIRLDYRRAFFDLLNLF